MLAIHDAALSKKVLFRNGQWDKDSFRLIVTAMFEYRPAIYLYKYAHAAIQTYHDLLKLACEYVETPEYLDKRKNLRELVWIDIKSFYQTLANMLHENPLLSEPHFELLSSVAIIWARVAYFPK